MPDLNDWFTEDEKIVEEAQKRFRACEDWESQAWANFEYDYKFANGDSVNMFQWDNWVIGDRLDQDRPCLTINKTMQHNLQIINDGKQNKPGVNIRPVGDEASFDAAQIFEEICRHIEYISSAENIYDKASEFQVIGGIGYWRIITDWVDPAKGFDQEIYIKGIKHPRSVRLDPNITETDGSDARFGFIFNDIPKDLYEADYPDFKDVGGSGVLGNTSDGWYTRDHVRVAEYFRKSNKKDKWIWFILPETKEEIDGYYSKLKKENPEGIAWFEAIKKHEKDKPVEERTYREREVTLNNVEWFKIAGNKIISKKPWLGKYIPIVRIVGLETIIDGQLDRKGHTRALLDPQRIYNVNPLALNTLVPTPSGWSTMGELKSGDYVFNECGEPVKVVGESPIFLQHKCYRVEFTDGSHIIADENHPWIVDEKRSQKDKYGNHFNETLKLTTKELNSSHRIWSTQSLNMPEIDLPVHPYILGLWLGDGVTVNNRISTCLEDLDEVIENINSCGYRAGNPDISKNSNCASLTIHGLREGLRNLGLFGNKHIPNIYLRSSIEQRFALLQGLMDTDGHSSINGKCVFNNSDKSVISGTAELIRSLGIRTFIQWFEAKRTTFPNGITSDIQPFSRIRFTANPEVPIFKLKRKAINHSKPRLTHERRTKYHVIKSVTEVHSVPVKCITVDSLSHLFLVSESMIATHNSSANVEFGALQTKSPITASGDAIEGYEEYYKNANINNPAWLPFNAYDDEGRPLQPPSRMEAPKASPAYVQQMKIAQEEMMMVSGQYQAQMGENENAKSGVAINQRQRQGDRATYHFLDGQGIGIRYTGKQLIDLMKIEAKDGSIINLTIDPNHDQAMTKQLPDPNQPQIPDQPIDIIFNPNVGQYAVVSDTGPSFATRRQEAFNALTQIAAQNKEFMNVGGDLLWKVADFPEAQELARRWRRLIPPNITGDAPNPQLTDAMHQAANKIEQQLGIITQQTKELADKNRELDLREREIALREKEAEARENREDYKAENQRIQVLGNSGPAITPEQIQPVLQQLLRGMLIAGELDPVKLAMGIRDIEHNAQTSEKLAAANGSAGDATPA
jgi:hypothetical protein